MMISHLQEKRQDIHVYPASKLDIRVFDEQGCFPFKEINLSFKCIYEIHDETLRTPLEKAEIFEQLLNIPNECELWIVPVQTETSAIIKSIKDEKTSSLFNMLAAIRDNMQFDRTFIVAKSDSAYDICTWLRELDYTIIEKTEDELQQIQVTF
ncbi:hypothetical protein QYG89_11435 [Bacillus sp. B190/17]|uniref:Uncharacterized protein n=1 Tax=Bacillus lumedeiriae TaxID=3058829 RepID=A0ABW8I9W6_9BACI